jgi:hypothetical protein
MYILFVPPIPQQIQISVDQPYTGPAASCYGIVGTHSIYYVEQYNMEAILQPLWPHQGQLYRFCFYNLHINLSCVILFATKNVPILENETKLVKPAKLGSWAGIGLLTTDQLRFVFVAALLQS